FFYFFLCAPATADSSPLSLHDALPILLLRLAPRQDRVGRGPSGLPLEDPHRPERSLADAAPGGWPVRVPAAQRESARPVRGRARDRKSTRLNSSHDQISYAVFCLKKKT